jgi:hypothetical protein
MLSTHSHYELIISSDSDASSGIYDSRLEAMDAADEAAAVDNLTAVYGTPNAGYFKDSDGNAWFHFEIKGIER